MIEVAMDSFMSSPAASDASSGRSAEAVMGQIRAQLLKSFLRFVQFELF